MPSEVIVGNAAVDGSSRWGWFIGHFIEPSDSPRSTPDVEVKWATHKAGEGRSQWAVNASATTVSILISGCFRLQFSDREVVLSQPGDYALWLPGVRHWWLAESDCTVLTVRWPSKQGDSVDIAG
ncbi:signal peptidase I [Microseira wollei]|uniref:Signal peptidase I n=1 Tax=Microseira wollei NIES-4236 TaxID=2530354 RepID=A0AAV3XF86_9CYAN|nr:signal peptidase I [Microseira wollei]GET39089.1 hypothetical protein MiSe_38500 [Microseira wollei NIES-4236]